MKLFKYGFQLLRNGKSQVCCIQHDIYKALNGDGWADALFTSAMELPTV